MEWASLKRMRGKKEKKWDKNKISERPGCGEETVPGSCHWGAVVWGFLLLSWDETPEMDQGLVCAGGEDRRGGKDR